MADPTPPPPSASAPFEFTFRSKPPRSTDPRLSQRRAFLPPPDDNGRRRIRPTDGGGDDDRMDGPSALSSAVAPTIKRGWGWGLGLGTDEEQLSRDEEQPPSKRRRGVAGTLVDGARVAASASLSVGILTAVAGITAYRLWRDRGKHVPQASDLPPARQPRGASSCSSSIRAANSASHRRRSPRPALLLPVESRVHAEGEMGGQGPPTLFSLPSRSLGHRDEEAIVDEPPPTAEAGRGYFLSPPPPAYESYHGQPHASPQKHTYRPSSPPPPSSSALDALLPQPPFQGPTAEEDDEDDDMDAHLDSLNSKLALMMEEANRALSVAAPARRSVSGSSAFSSTILTPPAALPPPEEASHTWQLPHNSSSSPPSTSQLNNHLSSLSSQRRPATSTVLDSTILLPSSPSRPAHHRSSSTPYASPSFIPRRRVPPTASLVSPTRFEIGGSGSPSSSRRRKMQGLGGEARENGDREKEESRLGELLERTAKSYGVRLP